MMVVARGVVRAVCAAAGCRLAVGGRAAVGGMGRRCQHTDAGEEQEGKHIPYGQEGTGYYSLATKGCFDVINNASDLALNSLRTAVDAYKARNDGKPFVIADYGTADAGTSMPLITVLLKELETLIGEDPVTIIYEDQTTNDFNSVFKRAHGLIPTPQSYKDDTPLQPFVQKYNNTFVMASGTSFYEQVTPNETVDLGISATAMHWLTSSPCAIPDALHSAYSKDAATLAKYEEQAFSDLLRIFQHRAAELKSGGQFVCINFAKDDKGQFLGHTEQTPACMHTTFYELWCEMADEGLITKQEVLNTNFPNQYRTIREHQRVLDDASLSSLEVQTLNTRVVPCPYRQSLLKGEIEPAKYAATFVPTTRTWSNSTFVSGLDDSRSAEEKDALVDEMFNRYAARISKNPTDHGMDYVHAYLAFAKK